MASLAELLVRGEARVISNFALTHFNAAKLFAAKTAEVEAAHAGQGFGNFWEEISIYCASSIITAAASLEALINELFITPGELHNTVPNFDEFFWGESKRSKCWLFSTFTKARGLERKPALQKYKKAVESLRGRKLSKSDQEYAAAEALIGFRNHLIHFKPLWDEGRRDERLEDRLNGRFALSPFPDGGASFLNMKCMSAGCANWSVATVAGFVTYFADRSNLRSDKFASFTV